MRSSLCHWLLAVAICTSAGVVSAEQREQEPETPVEKWAGKTVLLIGAHADDDALSHGTLAMLQAHGNQVYVMTLTTGNVGTQDPTLSRAQLAQIRRQEELAALAEMGIPGEHYINLGYDDGLLEFEDRKAVVESLVRWIRRLRPDVLLAWDPGKNYQRWHKSDHRAASYLAADAARAAMWRLLFEDQITREGLKEYMIPEYLFYNDYDFEDENIWVDISEFVDKRVNAGAKYVSQFGPGWKNYKPDLSETELKQIKEGVRSRVSICSRAFARVSHCTFCGTVRKEWTARTKSPSYPITTESDRDLLIPTSFRIRFTNTAPLEIRTSQFDGRHCNTRKRA